MRVEFARRLTGRKDISLDGPSESHFTAENAAGASNWLLMFSTSWPSFSVLATTATHSGSARKAPPRFSRSALLSQASMYGISPPPLPIRVGQNPAPRMPCFSQIRSGIEARGPAGREELLRIGAGAGAPRPRQPALEGAVGAARHAGAPACGVGLRGVQHFLESVHNVLLPEEPRRLDASRSSVAIGEVAWLGTEMLCGGPK